MFMTAGEIAYCAGYRTCRGGYLRGLLTGLFKLIAIFYMFDLDYHPVHSMFMEIMQTFVMEEQVYSGIEYLPVSGERTGTKISKFSGCIPYAIFFKNLMANLSVNSLSSCISSCIMLFIHIQ